MRTIKAKPGTPRHMDETDNRTFEEWMKAIDQLVTRHVGLSVYDLDDCCYQDWYDDRIRPIWAANKALKQSGACEYS